LFVTSSGTGVGKTYATCALARALAAEGRDVRVLKPVISGFTAENLEESDSVQILRALGQEPTDAVVAAISPWRFEAPLSPDMAAAREGRRVSFDDLVRFCRDEVMGHSGDTLIEGVGGVMVPLDETRTVLDWIAALELPALLVVGSYLGTLSHTLTAVQALRAHGCAIAGVVVSESEDQPVPLAETVATLKRFEPGIPIRVLPRVPAFEADGRALLDLLVPS
jgi:dethiobiotin synthetase